MWNIKTAVRRLSYAPRPEDMKVTDVKTGRFTFVPPPAKRVSWPELQKAIVKAGYGIERTAIEVRGTIDAAGLLHASGTGQPFALTGARRDEIRQAAEGGARVSVYGRWGAAGGDQPVETIDAERWEIAK